MNDDGDDDGLDGYGRLQVASALVHSASATAALALAAVMLALLVWSTVQERCAWLVAFFVGFLCRDFRP